METIRPNIRIEIPNNVNEAMDIDNQESGENEEGEIQDSVDMNQCLESFDDFQTKIIPVNQTKVWMNEAGGFSTGIDILNKGTNERLEERAKRFGLKPNEIQNFTEENLQVLQDSLGVSYKNEKEIRFEAIHMRGTDDLSTEDIFEYFKKYGPSYIEWISDDSCNVVWEDKLSSARALYFTSKAIQGMPVEGPCNPFVKELEIAETEEDENRGHSILLQNREIELQKEDNDDKENSTKYIHILDIKIPIPPGYWRLGLDHPKSKGILMRFSFRSDKKPFKAEKFSEFYKKYGNPNYGGLQGIISESKRRRMHGIFSRNKDIGELQDNKNPWGILAKNWHEDAIFCEKEYKSTFIQKKRDPTDKTSIMNRLGFKRAHSEENKQPEEETMEKSKTSEYQKKKIKFPRMRMYADEEEEKLKHKKKVSKIQTDEKPKENDLRKFLESGRKVSKRFADEIPIIDITDDLGDKIKSRFLKEVRYTKNVSFPLQQKHTLRSDSILERKRPYVNPVTNLSPSFKDRSRERQSRHHRHSHNRIHHNSKYPQSDVENLEYNRTQSKVAVVVKKQKKPTVASTVWTRIHNAQKSNRNRLKGKSASSSATSSGSESSSESTSSTTSSSSSQSSSSESEESNNETTHRFKQIKAEVHRPGFSHTTSGHNHKSPLRIEIKNDRFKRK